MGNNASDFSTAPIEPGNIKIAGGIDLDSHQSGVAQFRQPLPAVMFQQTRWSVDMCAQDNPVLAIEVQELLDAQRRASIWRSSLLDGNSGPCKELFYVLLRAPGIEDEKEMGPVVCRNLDAWENDWSARHRRRYLSKSVDSLSRVVVGHRDRVKASTLFR